MKRLRIGISLMMVFVLIALAACGQNVAPADPQPGATVTPTPGATANGSGEQAPDGWVRVDSFLIAAVNHVTGPTALSGELRRMGYDLAKNQINAAGGINGLPIQIVYEDDQGTNQGAVVATQRVLSELDAYALMIDRSPMVHAIHPIIEEIGIPTLFGASAASISDLENPWFFRLRVSDAGNAEIMATFLVENMNKTRIASLFAADAFGEGGNAETQRALQERFDVVPVVEQSYTTGTNDFTAQLLAISAADADVIFAWGTNSEDNAIILRQFRQLGLDQTMDFIGSAAYASAVTIELAGDNINGVYAVNDFAPQDTRAEFQHWLTSFRETYDAEPDFWSLSTFDGIMLVADAARRAGMVQQVGNYFYMPDLETGRAMLAQALRETVDFPGAAGPYTADRFQNMLHNSSVVRVEDGALNLVDVVSLDIER